MEENISRLVKGLGEEQVETLLSIYYNKEAISSDNKNILDLIDKNLVSTKMQQGKDLVELTDAGLNLCGSVMFQRINDKKEIFKEKVSDLPQRGAACIVNRIMFRNPLVKESGRIDPVNEPYNLDESMWFERALLKDERMNVLLETLYGVLEDVGLARNINNQRWCTPEVEDFLKSEFGGVMDLSWMEEDSLKYYYFFCIYAQDQKNLINFAGTGEEYRSMFLGENASPVDYWFSSNRSDPRSFIANLGLSEHRIMEFLAEMQNNDFVNERYYPLSSFSFFSDEDKIFVIKDIKEYMEFNKKKFLEPVVDSLLSN